MEIEGTLDPSQAEPAESGGKQPRTQQAWAKLISLNPKHPHTNITTDEFVIGRAPDCHARFQSSFISGHHCRIYHTVPTNGGVAEVYVEDMSQNGTFVNGVKVGKGCRARVNNTDEISLVVGVGDTQLKGEMKETFVAYMFQDLLNKVGKRGKPAAPAASDLPAAPEPGATGFHAVYDIGEALGSGNFATVHRCAHKVTKRTFAVKVINKKKFWLDPSFNDKLEAEVAILKRIHHPNVVSCQDVFDTKDTMFIVMDLVSGGELFDRIVESGKFSEDLTRHFLVQMLDAVRYLHSNGIVHRDLKPENILLADKSANACIKITDFGLAKIVGEEKMMCKTFCGTPQYFAPEVLNVQGNSNAGYGRPADLWSIGVILYIMLCGHPPFYEEREPSLFEQIENAMYDFPERSWRGVSNDAKDLIRKLLIADPAKRYTVEQCMAHRFISDEEEGVPPPLAAVGGLVAGTMLAPSPSRPPPAANGSTASTASTASTNGDGKREADDDEDEDNSASGKRKRPSESSTDSTTLSSKRARTSKASSTASTASAKGAEPEPKRARRASKKR